MNVVRALEMPRRALPGARPEFSKAVEASPSQASQHLTGEESSERTSGISSDINLKAEDSLGHRHYVGNGNLRAKLNKAITWRTIIVRLEI